MSRLRKDHGGVVKVLLIILGVIVLLMVCAGIYVATHWKGWAAAVANNAAEELVKESGLPQDQRDEIVAEIRKLGEDFKSGVVTTEQLGRMAKTIAEGPLVPLAGVQAARSRYIDPSDMTAEEKAAGVLTLQRLARGIYEKKIPTNEVNDIVKPVADLKPNGRWTFKEHPSRMEIDQFLANAKARADELKVPEEPFDLNIVDELRKAIHDS